MVKLGISLLLLLAYYLTSCGSQVLAFELWPFLTFYDDSNVACLFENLTGGSAALIGDGQIEAGIADGEIA